MCAWKWVVMCSSLSGFNCLLCNYHIHLKLGYTERCSNLQQAYFQGLKILKFRSWEFNSYDSCLWSIFCALYKLTKRQLITLAQVQTDDAKVAAEESCRVLRWKQKHSWIWQCKWCALHTLWYRDVQMDTLSTYAQNCAIGGISNQSSGPLVQRTRVPSVDNEARYVMACGDIGVELVKLISGSLPGCPRPVTCCFTHALPSSLVPARKEPIHKHSGAGRERVGRSRGYKPTARYWSIDVSNPWYGWAGTLKVG